MIIFLVRTAFSVCVCAHVCMYMCERGTERERERERENKLISGIVVQHAQPAVT